MKVVTTRKLPDTVEARLSELFDVELHHDALPMERETLIDAMKSATVLVATLGDMIGASELEAAGAQLKLITNYGSGYDHIDVDAARSRGILVTNTPGATADDTADMTLALILATMRRFKEGSAMMQSGDWEGWSPSAFLGQGLSGKSLGIIGLGRVGRAVATRARAFGMDVHYHNRNQLHAETEAEFAATYWPNLDEILPEMDVVSLNCPYTPGTYHLINADRIARMRSTAVVVNTSRGELLDEAALADALDAGKLAGAGLDVFEKDPDTERRLRNMPNVMMLPHMGSATLAARTAMGDHVIRNIKVFEDGHTPPNVILPGD
ncbi:MAG: D-glycerate dehydrogenase [Pseudomonadota bacterium]